MNQRWELAPELSCAGISMRNSIGYILFDGSIIRIPPGYSRVV